jgi:ferric-dicitrate binding protein FerR (iron transport regulator)
MSRHTRSKLNTQISEEASAWFVECRAGDLDRAGRRDFDDWLRKSPEHLSAYLEIAAIWNQGPSLDPQRKWPRDRLIQQALGAGGDNVVPLPGMTLRATHAPDTTVAGAGSAPVIHPTMAASAPTNASGTARSNSAQGWLCSWRRLAIAASVAGLATLGYLVMLEFSAPTYATALGEQRSLQFADGSTVELNSRSKIRVKYSKQERDVELLRGQALFHVAHDTTRPFIVSVGGTRVRAVGTQFDVYKKSTGTVVTVVEGRVAVYPAPQERPVGSGPMAERESSSAEDSSSAQLSSGSALPSQPRRSVHATSLSPAAESRAQPDFLLGAPSGRSFLLAAGEQLTVTPEAAEKALNPNIANATSWRDREVVFESASLSDVAEEFNRYNERQLVIKDPQALTFHVSGVFSSTDPDSLIRFLRQRSGVKVTEIGSQILIEEAKP